MNFDDRLRLTSFFLTIAEWERQAEVIRQVLNGVGSFEPYAAFTRLSRYNNQGKIDALDI
jgi:hypothetical protein